MAKNKVSVKRKQKPTVGKEYQKEWQAWAALVKKTAGEPLPASPPRGARLPKSGKAGGR